MKSKSNFKMLNYCKSNIDQIIPFFILIAVLVLIGILQPGVFNVRWVANKVDATMILIFVSVGQSFVMLVNGMDLSIAGVMALTNCISAVMMTEDVLSSILVIILCLVIGVAAGVFNGLVVVKLNLQPFIATFATWTVFQGISLTVLNTSGGSAPSWYMSGLLHRFGGTVPVSVLFVIVIALVWIYLRKTKFGISLFAVGSNPESAFFNGINVQAVKIKAFAICGLFAAIAGVYRTGCVGSGSPLCGDSYTLMTFCAAVLGGINIAGGRGSIIGTIIGSFILKLLTDLLLFAGLSTYWTSLVQGVLLIIVVTINSVSLIIKNKRNSEEAA